jgi:hypothetical protein
MTASGTSEDKRMPTEDGMNRPFGIATGRRRSAPDGFRNQPLMRKNGMLPEGFDQGNQMLLAASGPLVRLDEAGLMEPSLENGVLASEFLVGLFSVDEGEFLSEFFTEGLFHGVSFHGSLIKYKISIIICLLSCR